jgi:uncharacterized membrane protein YczE
VIRAGLARAAKLFVGVALASAAVSLLTGLALGAGATRALSVGWYCAGAFLLLLGFVASTRGPTRAADTGGWAPVTLRGRSLRWATRSEQEEAIGLSAVLVLLGLVLIALGVAVDPRHPLF